MAKIEMFFFIELSWFWFSRVFWCLQCDQTGVRPLAVGALLHRESGAALAGRETLVGREIR